MSVLTPSDLTARMEWRYATQIFESTKKIDEATWKALEKSLILTPSSYGLQPWKFVIVQDAETRQKLKAVSYNQPQVDSCSHFVVFAHKTEVSEAYIDEYIKILSEVQNVPIENFARFKNGMMRDLVTGTRSKAIHEWAARQCYIAIGNFMTSAAVLGVDTCPMEGLKPAEYDKILGLEGSGYQTVLACAAGYRSSLDNEQRLKKVRFAPEKLIEYI